jgi:predicted house-cleaning NTP pyrophosphatase (Maf/HAM1 superfamily)
MTTRLCLASQSPRRAALLRQAGYEFEIVEPKVDEAMMPGEDPSSLTEAPQYDEGSCRPKDAGT